jgi:hypothetical protein
MIVGHIIVNGKATDYIQKPQYGRLVYDLRLQGCGWVESA